MASRTLADLRILIVEDEYFLADDARAILAGAGAEVVGPVATAAGASALIAADTAIDYALLDVNLRGEMAYDVADTLTARRIPFAFVTGYDRDALPERFCGTPTLTKPAHADQLIGLFERLAGSPDV